MGTLEVGVSTAATGPFTNLFTWNGELQTSDVASWAPIGVDLTAYNGQVIYLEFANSHVVAGFEGDMSIDLIEVTACGNFCPDPSQLAVTGVSSSSADLNWTENGSAATWEYEIDVAGFTQGMGANGIVSTMDNTTNPITGLSSATSYDYYVRSICSATETSLWIGPFSFSTTPDYCAGDLFLDSGGATSDYQNNENITYNICPDNPGDTVTVDFTFNEMEDSFAGCWDGLTIYDGPDTSFPTINPPGGGAEWCWDNGSGTGDLTQQLLVGTSASGCLTFVWSSDGSGQRAGWSANVTCAPLPSCTAPSALIASQITGSSADLSWTENGSATVWQVEVQPNGTAQGTAGAVYENMTATNPVTATGLGASTSYDYFVRADCGSGDLSTWAGPFTFITPCAPFIAPYGSTTGAPGNDFATFPGICWEEGDNTDVATGPNGLNGDWQADDFGNDTANVFGQAARVNIWNSGGDNDWLVSPEIDLGTNPATALSATFDVALTAFAATTTGNFGSDDQVQFLITTDSGVTWNIIKTYEAADNLPAAGQLETFPLGAYSGVVRFAFWSTNGSVADGNDVDFFVDNFTVDGTVGVNDADSFEFSYYPNPTDNLVTFNGQQVIDGIIVRNLLGQQLLVAQPNATSSSIDLSTFPSGMYLIEVASGEQSRVVKVIRN
jgi:hypothetical protein